MVSHVDRGFHLGLDLACGQRRKQSKRRQGVLFFAHEVRVEDPNNLGGGDVNRARLSRGARELRVQIVTLHH